MAPANSADLSLRDVALVRTSEGRVAARGTAARLDYRRAGGHLDADVAAMTVFPERSAQVASFGAMHFSAPTATGEVGARHGVASGGVRFSAARGDQGDTESLEYDGETIHGDDPVRLSGPGYRVQGHGVVARADGSIVTLRDGVSGTLQAEDE
jgi:lipopolysaccharide export system protein LptC